MNPDWKNIMSEYSTSTSSLAEGKKLTLEALECVMKTLSIPQKPFAGVDLKIVPDEFCTIYEHIGHWLNGYRGSRHRSKRITKKLLYGTRKKCGLVTAMTEKRTHAYMLDPSVFGLMHYGFGKPSMVIPKSSAIAVGLTVS